MHSAASRCAIVAFALLAIAPSHPLGAADSTTAASATDAATVDPVVWHARHDAMRAQIAAYGPLPGESPLPMPPPDSATEAAYQQWAEKSKLVGGPDIKETWLHDPLRELIRPPPEDPKAHAWGAVDIPALAASLHDLLQRHPTLPPKPLPTLGVWHPPTYWRELNLPIAFRRCGAWWLASAGDHQRAAAALADLDALLAAVAVPSPEGVDLLVMAARQRDCAYLVATIAGTCPPAAAQRWRALPFDPFANLIAEQQRWRRYEGQVFYARAFASLPTLDPRDGERANANVMRDWLQLPERSAADARQDETVEEALITRGGGGRIDPWNPDWTYRDGWVPGKAGRVLQAMACHRLALLACTALGARAADGTLPDTLPLADADLAPGADRPGLRCDHDSTHLRIQIDPASKMPDYMVKAFAEFRWGERSDAVAYPLALTPRGVAVDLGDPALSGVTGVSSTPAARAP
jgi:hypothetical protein